MSVYSKSLFSYDNFIHAIAGALGSVVGMTVFYPLDTVRCRLQLEENRKSENTLIVMKELVEQEGFFSLYRGLIPVLQSLCASNFVYFYSYQGLKNLALTNGTGAGVDLVASTIAGITNTLLTTPLWMVNTRMKMNGVSDNKVKYKSLIDGLIKVYQAEGIVRLWRGTTASLLLVSNPVIHMVVYQAIKRNIPNANSAADYFFIGAAAKAISTILTYPIQLVQTKLRHGHSHSDLTPDAGMMQMLLYILKNQGVSGLFKGMEAKLLQTILTAALMFMTYEKLTQNVFRIMRK